MNILVVNSGSSSIKFQVIDSDGESVLASGLVERIGEPSGRIRTVFHPGSEAERTVATEDPIANHKVGMQAVIDVLTGPSGVIAGPRDIGAVGHRVVHGGEDFSASVHINDAVIAAVEANIPLAPLHNPANLDGIRVALDMFPDAPQVAVFDTAFHQTMPEHAYLYAVPRSLYDDHKVRRYGFHGTSHRFVAQECARLLAKPLEGCNLITVHLGNGCSIAAIENGRSVDTSMGMTPLEGLVMGTRSGDVDPALHLFLAKNLGLTIEQIDTLLNKHSGLKGLCGNNDVRDIVAAADAGDALAGAALATATYRNRKYLGAYCAVLGHVDAIVFTAGIGENSPEVRAASLHGLQGFGVHLDAQRNQARSREARRISTDESAVAVFVIPTNEELAIARETAAIEARK